MEALVSRQGGAEAAVVLTSAPEGSSFWQAGGVKGLVPWFYLALEGMHFALSVQVAHACMWVCLEGEVHSSYSHSVVLEINDSAAPSRHQMPILFLTPGWPCSLETGGRCRRNRRSLRARAPA
eukprot:5661295-Pleurochrysis_carterae.AAC.1